MTIQQCNESAGRAESFHKQRRGFQYLPLGGYSRGQRTCRFATSATATEGGGLTQNLNVPIYTLFSWKLLPKDSLARP